jgi:hypothetical protein
MAVTAAVRGVGWGLPLDDAWIHAAFARHLAQGEGWVLFTGAASGGETSLLWPWLLIAAERWGAAAPVMSVALGAAAWLVAPGLIGCLATSAPRARVLAVVAGLCGPLLFVSLSGMEAVPALAVGLGAIHLFARGRATAGLLLAAAAVWLRPDASLLVVILALVHLLRRESVRVLIPGVSLALIGLAGLAFLEGSFPPATLGGRRWISGLEPGLSWSGLGGGFLGLARDWLTALDADLGVSRVTASWPSATAGLMRWAWRAAVVLAVSMALTGAWRSWRAPAGRDLRDPDRSRPWTRFLPRSPESQARWLVLVWTGALLLFYGLVLPDRGHVGRYQPQVYVLFALALVEGTVRMLGGGGAAGPAGAAGRAGTAIATLLLVAGWGGGVGQAAKSWAGCIDHLNRVHRRAANELGGLVGEDGIVAVFDVGVAAYVHGGAMIDMSGLSDPAAASALHDRTVAEWLAAREATHVLLPVFEEDTRGSLRDRLGLMSDDGVDLERIAVYEIPRADWGPAFQYSGHAFRRLFLYRIRGLYSSRHADRRDLLQHPG